MSILEFVMSPGGHLKAEEWLGSPGPSPIQRTTLELTPHPCSMPPAKMSTALLGMGFLA